MSIIIRLQNLPLNAKSGDIRNFFGGLRIPDGGVHILGGDNGDAFIAFMSDEDGRLAMRKDGGKIKDSRVTLYLSSRMEMQHEVEKLTKSSLIESSKSSSKSGDGKRRRSRSRSPLNYRDRGVDKSRSVDEYRQRSRSPVGSRSKRSPRKRSGSPKRYGTSDRSPPSGYRSNKQEKKCGSPGGYSSFVHELESESKSSDQQQSASRSQLQAELERRITEELEKGDFYRRIAGEANRPPDWNVGGFNMSVPFDGRQPSYGYDQNLMPFQPPYDDERQFMGHFNPGYSAEQDVARPMRTNFFVLLSDLDPQWNHKKVQTILKGYFAPQGNIRFVLDRNGLKTGKAVVKVANEEDYESIKKMGEVTLDGRKVTLSKCNFTLIKKLFAKEYFTRNRNFENNQDFCYTLKGIPFSCKYDNVVKFFDGYEIADLLIIYRENGLATGTGFVCFKTRKDFEGAFSQNGKKIYHRYIEMLPCSIRDMIEAKNSYAFQGPPVSCPSFSNGPSFTPYSTLMAERRLPMTRRPLCALLTGLPPKTTAKKICSFFSKSDLNPDAIHLTVNTKRLSDGRAFVEFSNFLDFEAALKFHGDKLDNNIICVKQILYDEMVKILDSQKARHHFNTPPLPPAPALNIPERVPYLWEPPDASVGPNETQMGDSLDGASFETARPAPPAFHSSRHVEKPFDPNTKPAFSNEYVGSWNTYSKPDEIFPSTSTIPHNPDLNIYERMMRTGSLTEEHAEMDSNRSVDISAKISELFDSFKKYEDNIKTSRLSPDNEAALLQFLNSKKSPDFDATERRNSYTENSLGMTEYSQDKVYKSSSREDSRSRDGTDSRYYDDWKADSLSGSFLPDRIESEKKSVGCVVHISNVSTATSTEDLTYFLKGFDYFENTLIRRYTDANEPTNDVRVTFLSRREAERAVRVLDKHYVRNRAVRLKMLS